MNETAYIENYLSGTLSAEEQLLAEARMLLDSELRSKAEWQQHTYALVKQYSRKALKQEIEAVHQKLFAESRFAAFRKKIRRIFE